MIKKYNEFIYEGVRDQMTPKSNDELKDIVDAMPNHKQYRYVMRYDIADLYNEDELTKIQNDYIDDGDLAGKRIKLISMIDDPNPIQPGTEGTVTSVDGMNNIQVHWDNGRTLALIPDVDQYQIIKE